MLHYTHIKKSKEASHDSIKGLSEKGRQGIEAEDD